MTSGGQCVMTYGTALMLLWSASNCDMNTLEVGIHVLVWLAISHSLPMCVIVQVAGHTAMPTLVLAVDQSSWMMFSVLQVPASY